MNILNLLLVGLGGALGSMGRYSFYIIEKSYGKTLYGLPIATFSVNIIGSFLIGCFLSKLITTNFQHSAWTTFIIIGVLGGFTTFSSFSAENLKLLLEGKIYLAISYILLSVIIGILMTYVGFIVTKT